MKDLRESIHSYKGIPVIVTYHPSALLRNPNWKYPAWDDLKKLKELLDKANG
jgi:DNA polymerase